VGGGCRAPPSPFLAIALKSQRHSAWHPGICLLGKKKREQWFSHSYPAPQKLFTYNYNCACKGRDLAESIYHMDAAKEMYFGFPNTCFFALVHLYFLLGMHE